MANNEYKPVTAQDAIADLGPLATDEANLKTAEKAGVQDAAYVDYEKALKNYESRSDIETLEQRLARENGSTFSAAKHVREVQDSEYIDGDRLAAARKAQAESDKFKAGQAKETAKVSDGREVADLTDVAKEQADDK